MKVHLHSSLTKEGNAGAKKNPNSLKKGKDCKWWSACFWLHAHPNITPRCGGIGCSWEDTSLLRCHFFFSIKWMIVGIDVPIRDRQDGPTREPVEWINISTYKYHCVNNSAVSTVACCKAPAWAVCARFFFSVLPLILKYLETRRNQLQPSRKKPQIDPP